MKLYNLKHLKNLRRVLRRNQTEAEKLLWRQLRSKQLGGLKFFRQYGVGNYILDFYCPKLKLAIELDGGQHNQKETRDKDVRRSKELNKYGIKVIRFWDNQVFENLEGVIGVILGHLENSS
jgi:very-short-patch-repair endonuclease